ncbi:MAG: glycoside hydrolase family 3 C-terminal domain-containing protein, partial [Bifidobacteriaceae bacterium]|nr:glycoside hydrolase family 3 C-terminal domain-containing protein [Bifidobacteriaceae bacterium]
EAPVLLKNNGGVLPVPAGSNKKIAVVGYLGGEETHGNYTPYLSPVMGTEAQSAHAALANRYGTANVVYIPGIVDRDYLDSGTGGIWAGSWTGRDHALDPSASRPSDVSPYLPPEWGDPLDTNPALANSKGGFQSGTTRGGRLVTLQKPRLGDSTQAAQGLLQFAVGGTLLGNPVPPSALRDEDVWGWGGRSNPTGPAQWTDTGVWEGSFELDTFIDTAANQIKLVQSGVLPSDPANGLANTAAPTSTRDQAQIVDPQGRFEVHVGSKAGPVAATIPADGLVHTVDYTGPKGNQHLFFDYVNSAYAPEDFASHTTADPAGGAAKTDLAWIEDADLVVAVVGTRTREAYEGYDRASLDLSHAQDQLVSQVAALNPNTVAWIQSVEQVNVELFKDAVPAMVWVSYNGQWQGDALAGIVSGEVNPSGHLPFTWYTDANELPHILDYTITPTGGLKGRTYQYFTGGITYPFGHGLSYSGFTYSNPTLSATAVSPNHSVTASVDVANPSAVAGQAVVQLYATSPRYAAGSPDRPKSQLKGFAKVSIPANSTRTVTIPLKVSDLWFWDQAAGRQVVDTGAWTLRLGGSSATGPTTTLNVSGAAEPAVDQVVAIPDGVVLNTAAPDKVIHARLSATRTDQSFYDLATVLVAYTSSDPAVATVDAAGAVRPGATAGTAQITATVTAGGVAESTTFPVVTVSANPAPFPRPVVQLPDSTLTLAQAKAGYQLAAAAVPAVPGTAVSYRLAFAEPNGAAAAVADDGVFTASQVGETRVTATLTVPGFARPVSVSATVTVGPDSGSADWAALASALDRAKAAIANGTHSQGSVTPASWAALANAVAAAEAVLDAPSATPAQVAAALTALNAAVGGLVARGDLSILSALLGSYASLLPRASEYTSASWLRLASAAAAARTLFADPPAASVAQVAAAADSIIAALTALEPAAGATAVVKVKASLKALTLVKGKSATVAGAAYTASGTAKVAWKSSDKKVATVSAKGKVKAKKAGKATITLTAGSKSAKVAVRVLAKKPAKAKVAQVSAQVSATMRVGAAAYVTGTYKPATATAVKVSYSSSDAAVVAVDKAGRLVAKAKGTARITV